ncbi:AAA family ATPase [Microbacterium luticocti]|uniref:AAA family ATPase n=1 Tax=Microbacterium luticocti TaxID=451764 RepID=UPI000400C741|nr:P-loop NTPase [Microbacterium luticocti]
MTGVVIAVTAPRGTALADRLTRAGVPVAAVVRPEDPADGAAAGLMDAADALVLDVSTRTLDADLVAACDRGGVRILPLCADESAARLAAAFGLGPCLPADADGWAVADALAAPAAPELGPAPAAPSGPGVVAVWGAAGAPGRTTLAIELAAELSRGGRHVCLVDADTHAPSVAIMLGLADEGPGFAAACRQAERGGLDAAELERISTPVGVGDGRIDVLPGINRPSRWPELGQRRVSAALEACRSWATHTVVDVASPLERDEEIVSDLADGPRRNAATLAALQAADRIVAVVAADPVGVARFLRAHAELRAIVGTTPVTVVANRLRPGTLGIDAHGQIRRTLERFAGIRDVWFVPQDPRSVDAALLAARPVADTAPKSPLTLAVRRLVAEALVPPPAARPRRARWRSRAMIPADAPVAP